jgi:hypothetical protein
MDHYQRIINYSTELTKSRLKFGIAYTDDMEAFKGRLTSLFRGRPNFKRPRNFIGLIELETVLSILLLEYG